MKMALVAAALCLSAAAPTSAQEFEPDGLARQDMTLGRINPGAPSHFYRGEERPGCPAATTPCRRTGYVRPGDVVLLGKVSGVLVEAIYADNAGHMTQGWLLRSTVAAIATPPATPASWRGDWQRDEATIEVTPGGRPGTLSFDGTATYGLRDSGRVARGAVNEGGFSGESSPTDGRVLIGQAGDDQCRVSLRLIGPYLVVADNNQCGGQNVSFSGIYRR